jgi:hypothetical protein
MSVMLARIVGIIAGVVCAIIALAAIFILLDANAGNSIVSTVEEWGRSLAGPFDGIFRLDSAKWTVVLNYGIAIIVYSLIAGVITRLLVASVGTRRWGARRAYE